MIPFVVIGIVALIVVMAVFGHLQSKKRREEMAAWAAQHGLGFSEARDYFIESRHADFAELRRGDGGRYAYNVISGTFRGRPLLAFDYHYETHSTDSKGHRSTHHHHFTAAILECEVPLKPLTIRPEGLFDKLGSLFGFEDINFESAEFSRKYKVTSPDRKWAYDVLHARAIEFLLGRPLLSLQLGAGQRILQAGARTWKPAEIEEAAHFLSDFLDLLPEYVKRQHHGGVP